MNSSSPSSQSSHFFCLQMKDDLPSIVVPLTFITDSILIQQPGGIDIQLHGQCIGIQVKFHLFHQFTCPPAPVRVICCNKACKCLQYRFRLRDKGLRLRLFQIPDQCLRIPVQVLRLVRLIPPGYFEHCFAACPLILMEQEGAVRCPHQPVGP